MRVLHRAAEIPVTPQQELFDQFGRFIARADLLIDGTPRLHEYDGAVHRDADVHEADLTRDRALISAKFRALWVYVPATSQRWRRRSSPTSTASWADRGIRDGSPPGTS